jgi:hypothetical protein
MTQPEPASPAIVSTPINCIRATICGFLIPFFLTAAGGNLEAARAAILELIDAYNACTITELDLVGRIVGFSIVAMDNLRLSMTQDLSDTKVLRYRSNAVALSRAAEQARHILMVLQETREMTGNIPRPAIAAEPQVQPATPPKPQPAPNSLFARASVAQALIAQAPIPQAPIPQVSVAQAPLTRGPATPAPLPQDMEAMMREARIMLGAFSRHGAPGASAIPAIPASAVMARSAAREAITALQRS